MQNGYGKCNLNRSYFYKHRWQDISLYSDVFSIALEFNTNAVGNFNYRLPKTLDITIEMLTIKTTLLTCLAMLDNTSDKS